jgi:transcriptional regulator with XRE-family HTH domain
MLRRYRAAAGLSQEELAERAGISVRGLSDLERGLSRAPRLYTLRRLMEALELDASAQRRLATAAGYPAPVDQSPETGAAALHPIFQLYDSILVIAAERTAFMVLLSSCHSHCSARILGQTC